ncbi:spore germination protein GerPB [Bacillus sp. FJAT-50079]|uniref:spore germination protein GerPB n=1 Tax=Bacillus sp. FJAT-50079 TaxID=2833577 RepID=UPI001BC9FDA9|nr:spore germination protein GerPB [Bacillus sp. FJAT-50079]MBS4210663.1 spore gernimation protein [Bacillus sp. FJAT-50079]
MIINVQQSIHIHMIKIGGISNSSVFQIGTSGMITPASYLYNTGEFQTAAPEALKIGQETQEELAETSFVPL